MDNNRENLALDQQWHPDPPDYRDFVSVIGDCAELPDTFFVEGDEFESELLVPECSSSEIESSAVTIGGLLEHRLGSERVSKKFITATGRRLLGTSQVLPIRCALKAAKQFGVPLARYESDEIAVAVDSFMFGASESTHCLKYSKFSLGSKRRVKKLKSILFTEQQPIAFGFSISSSVTTTALDDKEDLNQFRIELYSTSREHDSLNPPLGTSTGILRGYCDRYRSFHFRSTWGEEWGNRGFGWISYELVKQGLLGDIWKIDCQE